MSTEPEKNPRSLRLSPEVGMIAVMMAEQSEPGRREVMLVRLVRVDWDCLRGEMVKVQVRLFSEIEATEQFTK